MHTNNYARVYQNNVLLANDWANASGNQTAEVEVEDIETIDRLAEEELTGKFNTHKSNLCGGCYTYRSNNGTCLCD